MKLKIILASASKQRKEMLENFAKKINAKIDVKPSDAEEVVLENPEETAIENAFLKLRNIKGEFVVSGDTFAFLHKPLFKPKNSQEAIDLLNYISGKELIVYTSTAVKLNDKIFCNLETTKCLIKSFSKQELLEKISNPKTLERAGAFGIEDVKCFYGNVDIVHGLNMRFIEQIYKIAFKIK